MKHETQADIPAPAPPVCAHPHDQRWQYRGAWMCCLCNRYFWGAKSDTPPTDIYGLPTMAPQAGDSAMKHWCGLVRGRTEHL
jgi:hypothetical protein